LPEQSKILATSGKHVDGYRDHMIFSLALGAALREAEIAALNLSDVVDSKGNVRSRLQLEQYKGRSTTKKAKPSQYVFLNRTLRAKLAKYVEWKSDRDEPSAPSSPLFVTSRQPFERVSHRTIRHICHLWQHRAGIDRPYNFHAFRHAALTNLYRLTKDIRLVQRMARHSDISITQIYAHVSDDEVAKGADELPC
jgi:site-specific recombinase XerD